MNLGAKSSRSASTSPLSLAVRRPATAVVTDVVAASVGPETDMGTPLVEERCRTAALDKSKSAGENQVDGTLGIATSGGYE